jgi:hypothetical protein
MDSINQLFSQYSIETLIVLVIFLAFSFKFVNELYEYFYNKIKTYFNHQSQKDIKYNEIIDSLNHLKSMIITLQDKIENQSKEIKQLQDHEKLTVERLQENSRSFIIDKHHYFCYEIKAIDDLNLQSMERRYLYYKAAGGNSFIDGLMEEIRELPRVDLSNVQIRSAIQTTALSSKEGVHN